MSTALVLGLNTQTATSQSASQTASFELFLLVKDSVDIRVTSSPADLNNSLPDTAKFGVFVKNDFNWMADTNCGQDTSSFKATDFDCNQLYTITFSVIGGEDSYDFQWMTCQSSEASDGYSEDLHGFYCLSDDPSSENNKSDLEVWYEDSQFKVVLKDIANSPVNGDTLSDSFTNDYWAWPHDKVEHCGTNTNCLSDAHKVNYFFTPQADTVTYQLAASTITAPSDESWTWNGKVGQFASDAKLIVKGEFSADSTTFEAASTSWDGIEYDSGSSGTLEDVTIDDVDSGGNAIKIYNASPTIRDSDITSSGNGIHTSGSSASPNIRNNTIAVGRNGVVWVDGSGYAQYNTISGSGSYYGVGAASGADPVLGQTDIGPGHNIVTDFSSGLYASGGSTLWSQGWDCVSDVGAYHLKSISSSDITAEQDWWGGGNPSVYTASGGTVDWQPKYSGSCPADGASKTLPPLPIPLASSVLEDLPGRLLHARHLLALGKTDEAIAAFKEIVEDAPQSNVAGSALVDLGRLVRRSLDRDLAGYLHDQAGVGSMFRLHILGRLIGYYFNAGDETSALETASIVEREGVGTWHAFSAQRQAHEYSVRVSQFEDAASILSRMEPTDELEAEYLSMLTEDLHVRAPEASSKIADGGSAEVESDPVVSEPSAYPNPFNPETTITFRLSESGAASIHVYDVLGRMVASLSSGDDHAGIHTVKWDASNVASGIYIAVITIGGRSAHIPLIVAK